MTKLTISHLPRDLLEREIFSKIPSKYVGAVRSTCKEWQTLIKSFMTMSFKIRNEAREEGESEMIVLTDNNICLISFFLNGGDPYIEFKGKRVCLDKDSENSEQFMISKVFHCEGLLLCILKHDATKIMVWNPYCGQTWYIQPRFSYRAQGQDRFSYALGYCENNNRNKSFKFLRFIDYVYEQFFWYEIYDFDSGLWTTLEITPHWQINFDDLGVSLKGNTYWLATRRNSFYLFVTHIICFDFKTEKFGPLLLLPFHDKYQLPTARNLMTSLSCVREEKLAALLYQNGLVEVWITTRIEAEEVSWSKFLAVDVGNCRHIGICKGSFFIDEVNKVAMIFDNDWKPDTFFVIGEAGHIADVDLGRPTCDQRCMPFVCPNYVPSLVEIKQPPRFKRKRQSSLENCRYNRNMLKLVSLEKLMKKKEITRLSKRRLRAFIRYID
ncbi:PREDICTED: putative F-box/kelch-repeat protein At3g22870 [Camelina sativa]|uniref:F-box/kelch-repeat protein At3g22870 n=1 Tax=Camelina sativa TaxID=90675 RepID=A0ABM0WB24_CAMSA|nr:PREDICTED: putative F-box/kelch-repeat protein At3g22870 [Camelina sativa]